MALRPTPLTAVSTFTANVYPPLPNSTVESADVSSGEQALLNRTEYLSDTKVDRAGDDGVTGRITITVATTDRSALVATANGTGYGVNASGGATGGGGLFTAGGGNNIGCYGLGRGTQPGIQGLGGATGAGGNFTAGGGNAAGVTAAGSGSGAGISCEGGATGPGITATSGTAQTNTAPTCAARFAGYIQLTGADPNQTVDPGANNVIHGANICKAFGTVALSGGSPYSPNGSYNVSSVVDGGVTGEYVVTFARAMANGNYTVVFGVRSVGFHATATLINNGSFTFQVFATDTLGLTAGNTVHFQVFGPQ